MNNISILCETCTAREGRSIFIPAAVLSEHRLKAHPEIWGPFEPRPRKMFQGYSEHYGRLLESQQHKVAELIENRCIEYAGGDVYICKPIPKYNKTTYRLTKDDFGEWQCTCQYSRTKGEMCAHICALYEFFARHQRYDSEPSAGGGSGTLQTPPASAGVDSDK